MKELVGTNTRDVARELARRYSTMTHDELDVLESILVPIKYAKGEIALSEGEICKNLLYIDKGLMRQFYFKHGKEVTEHLAQDHTIVMCIESLFKEEPTKLQIEAIEPTVVCTPCLRQILSVWQCTTSIYRFSTARYWRKASSYRRYMPTLCALRLHRTATRNCAN